MFRPTVIRPASRALIAAKRTQLLPTAIRCKSTAGHSGVREPTTSSAPPESTLQSHLAPGEEIDPQLDGYPQLPYVHLSTRPARGWWDAQERKNFGELVHEEEDVLGMWGPDKQPLTGLQAAGQISIAFSILGAFAYIIYLTQPEAPAVPRSYPYNGLEKELGGYVPARAEEEVDEE